MWRDLFQILDLIMCFDLLADWTWVGIYLLNEDLELYDIALTLC